MSSAGSKLSFFSNESRALIRITSIAAFVSISSGLFGFDTGSIGAITVMPQFVAQFGELSPLVRGFVVACILVPSAITGIFGGTLSDKISRKRTIALGCGIFAIGSAMSAASKELSVLILGRCIAGLGEGLFLSCLSVYVVEISPLKIRGKLVGVIQVVTTSALAIGYFICYGSVRIESGLSWRLPFIIQTVCATILALGVPFLPYSPRWLVMKGRRQEAEEVLDYLVGSVDDQIRKELLVDAVSTTKHPEFLAIFRKDVRRRTFLSAFLNIAQQLSGIDFVLYFSPLLFAQAGLDPTKAAFFASGVTGVMLVLACLVAGTYIDRIGRRPLFLIGGTIVTVSQLAIGLIYASNGNRTKAGQYLVILFIEVFAFGFSGTWSMMIKLYAAEIQPSETRSAATAFGQGCNQAVNFVVAVTGPVFLARSSSGPFITYAACAAFSTILAYFIMPETIGKSLESIDATFESTSIVSVQWPSFSRRGMRRRSNRNGSITLAGESREEFRENLRMAKLIGLEEI